MQRSVFHRVNHRFNVCVTSVSRLSFSEGLFQAVGTDVVQPEHPAWEPELLLVSAGQLSTLRDQSFPSLFSSCLLGRGERQ